MKKPRPIKLTKADKIRFWSKVDRRGPDDCWEWQASRTWQGYGHFGIGGSNPYLAHRIAFVIANGDTELCVLHHHDNPSCCNPKHLYAGTIEDNNRDRDNKGRAADNRGENSGNTKLTDSDVREIRRLYAGGWLQLEIAGDFGIKQTTVSAIIRRETWKHI